MKKYSRINERRSATCPLCSGKNVTIVGKPIIEEKVSSIIRKDYDVLECLNCLLYFVFPDIDLTETEWSMLYGTEYFAEMTSWHARSRQRDRMERLNWIREAFSGDIKDFLDIGCGEGYILIDARRRGWRAVGIDITDYRIPDANTNGIEFFQGNIYDKSFPGCSFDGIYLDSVLEHVLDPVKLVKEIRRILRPGGVLYVGVPNEDSLINDFKNVVYHLAGRKNVSPRIKPFKSPYHVVGFTEKSFGKIFNNNGFEFVRFRNFSGPRELTKFRPFTRPFMIHFMLLPLHWASVPMKKMVYMDAIIKKFDLQ